MKTKFSSAIYAVGTLAIVVMTGCGGGSGDAGHPGACTGSACNATQTAQTAQTAQTTQSQSVSAASGKTLCGFDVGPKLLEGTVASAHDGDTITLLSGGATHYIRLDSIDAPELAQPYGSASQSTLASAVLGKSVKVAYTKTDQYDRIVGRCLMTVASTSI